MSSINQNAYSSALPNFRNLGILLRILLIVNLAALAAAMVESKGPHDFWQRLLDVSIVVQPLLMLSMLALVALNDLLKHLPYYLGAIAVLALELTLATLLYVYGRPLLQVEGAWLERYWALTFL
ncbi:MAG TPA: hypothetical protein VFP00_12335, partial [Burkholderiales bacterium]|nr:hypothetical protein [Burkholderiales bacterium]